MAEITLRQAIEDAALYARNCSRTWHAQSFLRELDRLGFVVVPKEPTKEIETAHFKCHAKAQTVFAEFKDLWAAMIAARPKIRGV